MPHRSTKVMRLVPYFLRTITLLLFVFLISATTAQAQSGHVLNGVGPYDQAMSGAGMANPQDALTALQWNPAAIVMLPGNSLDFSIQFMQPKGDLSSSVNQGAFGPFGPQANMSGTTESDAGPFPIPAIGYANASETSPWAFGISALGVGGFGVDHAQANPMDPNANPILTPQPPNGLGFGQIKSQFVLFQFAPTAAYKISDNVAIGLAPTINYAMLEVMPFPATNPDDANGDGFPSYPSAPNTGTTGFGFQVGLQANSASGFQFGASLKSKQYFSEFNFESTDEAGQPRTFDFKLNFPMIVSGGVAYTGLPGWSFAADVRYIDYANTEGFDESGFNQDGSVKGFGWRSIWVIAAGIQYDITPKLPIRIGYGWNMNPIEDHLTFFNTPSPAIIQHHISGGLSYDFSPKVRAAFAIQYGLSNSIEGNWRSPNPMLDPAGAGIFGTRVKYEMSTLTGILGVTIFI